MTATDHPHLVRVPYGLDEELEYPSVHLGPFVWVSHHCVGETFTQVDGYLVHEADQDGWPGVPYRNLDLWAAAAVDNQDLRDEHPDIVATAQAAWDRGHVHHHAGINLVHPGAMLTDELIVEMLTRFHP